MASHVLDETLRDPAVLTQGPIQFPVHLFSYDVRMWIRLDAAVGCGYGDLTIPASRERSSEVLSGASGGR